MSMKGHKMKNVRKIIRIDGQKCDGCGQCVPACVAKVGVRGEVVETSQLDDQEGKGHAEMPGAG